MVDLKHTYSDKLHNKRIFILGPIPPPFGGVSVHVKRVIAKLKRQHNHVIHFNTCVQYRYRFLIVYLLKLLFFLLKYKPHEVHLHTLYLSNGLTELRFIMWLKRLLGYEVILIEHDCRYMYKQTDTYKRQLNKLMPQIKKQIFIGTLTEQSYRDNGILSAQQLTIESAFLPPYEPHEAAIVKIYPSDLFQFINNYEPVLLANGFQLSLYDDKDLYGFDLCVQGLSLLKQTYPTIGLLLVLAQVGDKAYMQELKHKVNQLALTSHVYWFIGQKELWPLLKQIDLFVRPTISDGASVSIQEALYFNKPVVASDVCRRPKAVRLFRSGDPDHLYQMIDEHFAAQQQQDVQQNRVVDYTRR